MTKVTILSLLLAIATVSASAQTDRKKNSVAPPTKRVLKSLGLAGKTTTAAGNGIWSVADGTTIYASEAFCNDVNGFGGPTPLFIAIAKSGKISAVAPGDNNETPDNWSKVVHSKLFKSWNGMTAKQAAAAKVDAVTGATYSSTAVIQTIKATLKKIDK